MLNFLKTFRATEDGAVTVDWVVLTAALVGLAIAVLTTIGFATTNNSDSLGASLQTYEGIDW